MRGIDDFYRLCYFLSLNARNAYIQGRRGITEVWIKTHVDLAANSCMVILCLVPSGWQGFFYPPLRSYR
jgi:hypothetical protein